MSLIGSILVKFGMQTAEFLQGSAQVRTESAKTNAAMVAGAQNAAGKTKNAYLNALRDIRSEFGKTSALGQTLRLFATTGALGGLSMAVNEIDRVTDEAQKLYESYIKGDDALRDQTAEFLKQIPIAGKLGDAMARVYEIIGGTTSYVAQMEEQTNAVNVATEAMTVRLKQVKISAGEATDFIAKMRDEVTRLDLELNNNKLGGKLFAINQSDAANFKEILGQASAAKNAADVLKAREDVQKLQDQLRATAQTIRDPKGGPAEKPRTIPNPVYTTLNDQLATAQQNLTKMVAGIDADARTKAFEAERRSAAAHISLSITTASEWLAPRIKALQDWSKEIEKTEEKNAIQFKVATTVQGGLLPFAALAKGVEQMKNIYESAKKAATDFWDAQIQHGEKASELVRQYSTPVETYQRKLREINDARGGLFGLSDAQVTQLKGRAFAELQNVYKTPAAPLLERRAGLSAFTGADSTIAEPIKTTAMETVKQTSILDQIRSAIKQIPGISGVMHIGAAST